MKIKRKEPYILMEGIRLYDSLPKKHLRLTLLLVENKSIIRDAIGTTDELKKTYLPTAEIRELEKLKSEIMQPYRKKDDSGNYVMTEQNGQSVHVITNLPEVTGKLKTLNEKYSDLIERYSNGEKEIEQLLEEEINLPLKKITNPEWLENLNPKVISLLAPIIACSVNESLLESKEYALNTTDFERILTYCKVK